jgi:hypothetical protein
MPCGATLDNIRELPDFMIFEHSAHGRDLTGERDHYNPGDRRVGVKRPDRLDEKRRIPEVPKLFPGTTQPPAFASRRNEDRDVG